MTELHAITPYGRSGASSRVRVFEWLDRVAPDAHVHAYLGTSNSSARTLLRRPLATLRAERSLRSLLHSRLRIVLLHRRASPFSQGVIEAQLLRRSEWGVYDFDDALQWDRRRGVVGNAIATAQAKTCIRCVRQADRVIAGNDLLAEWAGQFARDVVVIPSCVDPSLFRCKTTYHMSDSPHLVWVGSASTEKYLQLIAPALREVHRRTGARLTVIGAPHGDVGALRGMTDRIPWHEGTVQRKLADFDIAVAPLTDELYSRGKCAYKILQYAAAGLPVVASPVGANHSVGTAIGGRLAATLEDWTDQMLDLLEAPAVAREHLGAQARTVVEKSYSHTAWRQRWATAVGVDGTLSPASEVTISAPRHPHASLTHRRWPPPEAPMS
jgi:glycosyltransferase involved in cell wall biosynthesis